MNLAIVQHNVISQPFRMSGFFEQLARRRCTSQLINIKLLGKDHSHIEYSRKEQTALACWSPLLPWGICAKYRPGQQCIWLLPRLSTE